MLVLFLSLFAAQADEWESNGNGKKACNEAQVLLQYKKAQAAEAGQYLMVCEMVF